MGCVSRVYTDRAVFDLVDGRFRVIEVFGGATVAELEALVGLPLIDGTETDTGTDMDTDTDTIDPEVFTTNTDRGLHQLRGDAAAADGGRDDGVGDDHRVAVEEIFDVTDMAVGFGFETMPRGIMADDDPVHAETPSCRRKWFNAPGTASSVNATP